MDCENNYQNLWDTRGFFSLRSNKSHAKWLLSEDERVYPKDRVALEGSEKYANANKVAKQANENLASLGLKTTVIVISDVSKFDPEKLDKTDGVAVLGASKDQVSSYISDNLSSITSESFRTMTIWFDI